MEIEPNPNHQIKQANTQVSKRSAPSAQTAQSQLKPVISAKK